MNVVVADAGWEPFTTWRSPRTAIATPLRLPWSTSTKSASSLRIIACIALIEAS